MVTLLAIVIEKVDDCMRLTSNSRTKNTLINTAFGLFVKLFNILANFAVRTVFIKYLGVEYTGVSSVFTDVLTVLSFAELGIGSAITFALYKPIENKDDRQIARIMHFYRNAYYLIALVVFSLGIILIPFLGIIITNVPNIKDDITVIYILYIINTASSYLLIYKSTLLTANQQNFKISIVNIVTTIIRTALQLYFIIKTHEFLPYLIIQIVCTIGQNAFISRVADRQYRSIKKYKNEKLSKKEKQSIFKDIKALSLYKISGTVLNGTDSLIVSSMLGSGVVGYVSNYTMIITELYSISLQFLNSVTASIGNLVASKDSRRQYEVFCVMNFFCEFFYCVCSVCLCCLLSEFVGSVWLGKEYIIDNISIGLLCFDFFLKGNATVINTYRNANGLFVQGQYRPVIMAVINIISSIVAVKIIGLPGVYFGTVFSRIITQVWYDPMILYKHAFNRKTLSYFLEYFGWIIVMFSSCFLSCFINQYIIVSLPIISFVIHGLVCVLVTILISCILFWKTGRVYDTVHYILRTLRRS